MNFRKDYGSTILSPSGVSGALRTLPSAKICLFLCLCGSFSTWFGFYWCRCIHIYICMNIFFLTVPYVNSTQSRMPCTVLGLWTTCTLYECIVPGYTHMYLVHYLVPYCKCCSYWSTIAVVHNSTNLPPVVTKTQGSLLVAYIWQGTISSDDAFVLRPCIAILPASIKILHWCSSSTPENVVQRRGSILIDGYSGQGAGHARHDVVVG